METIIKDQIVQFLADKGLISKCQHAFIKHHSTASNLLASLRDWSIDLNSHLRIDILYIDFSKASIRSFLLSYSLKLELYGITGQLLNWIRNILSNRLQCVVIDRFYSPVCPVIRGVPQGSVIGPILLNVYINDIHIVCRGDTALLLFTDDATLYSNITLDNISISLQHSLDNLVQRTNDWQLTININQ
jgi:Reverse transcriptase (RNA-dependent DNA polymerase)